MFVRKAGRRRRWLLLQSKQGEEEVRELRCWYRLTLFLGFVEKGLGGRWYRHCRYCFYLRLRVHVHEVGA